MKNTFIKSICLAATVAVLLGAVLSTSVDARDNRPRQLTFVYSRPEAHPVTQWLILVYTEALFRMDMGFVFKDVPPARASIQSNKGIVDGELSRVHDYHTAFPHLIRVEEHNHYVTFSAFSTDPTIRLDRWESLRGTTYRVEYRRGVKKCADRLPRVIPADRLTEVDRIEQGIVRLLKGRTDVFVGVRDLVLRFPESDGFRALRLDSVQAGKIHEVGMMEETTGHAWLHESHREIAPQLARILRAMKKEGLFARYRDQAGILPGELRW